MAGWNRYGEDKKYAVAPDEADTNQNPKHVGDSLRTLTLEDRLELRKKARENEKKRKLSKKQLAEIDDDDDDDESPSLALKRTRSTDSTASNGARKPDAVVEDLDDVEVHVVVGSGGPAKPAAAGGNVKAPAAVGSAKAVAAGSDSEASLGRTTSTTSRGVSKPVEIVELDEDAPQEQDLAESVAVAARRARRRAKAALAQAGAPPCPVPELPQHMQLLA